MINNNTNMTAGRQERLENFLEARRRIILAAIFLATAALYLSTVSNQLGGNLGGDNARYIMLARSLADGKGYRETYLPGEPPHTKYPFVFPALLAPLTFLGRYELLAMHMLISIMAVFIPFFIYGWMRKSGFSATASFAVLLSAATMPRYFSYLLHILSEIPFMFFIYLAFFILSRARARESESNVSNFIMITIISLLAIFTRTIGFCLFAAILFEMVIHARFRKEKIFRLPLPVFYLACFALAFGAWSLRNHFAGSGEAAGYFAELFLKDPYQPDFGNISLAELLSRIFRRSFIWISRIGLFIDGVLWIYTSKSILMKASGFVFSAFIFVGICLGLIKGRVSEAVLFILYITVISAWPFDEARFHLPVLPLAVFFFFTGVHGFLILVFSRKLSAKNIRSIIAFLWIMLFLYQCVAMGHIEVGIQKKLIAPAEPIEIKGYGIWEKPVADWSKYEMQNFSEETISYLTSYIAVYRASGEILPADAVILSRKPAIAAFFSGRKTSVHLFTHDLKAQWGHIRDLGITHIMGGFSYPYLDLFIERNKMFLEPVLEAGYPEMKLYRVVSLPPYIFGGGEIKDRKKQDR